MTDHAPDLAQRIAELERRLRRAQLWATAALLGGVLLALTAWTRAARVPSVLRARELVIEDSLGNARVVLGAPVPDPKGGPRMSPATGMVINDAAGFERFGVGVTATGSANLGLDAPPHEGRAGGERVDMSASENGGAEFRMLDHRSYVRAHMEIFDDNTVALFFEEPHGDTTFVHRVSATGDTVVIHRR